MPELPEVELVATSLNSLVKGFTIGSAKLFRERLAPGLFMMLDNAYFKV